eukprot:COSAG02_NODE_4818_length_4941_cov_1.653862_3_plen_318_part_00
MPLELSPAFNGIPGIYVIGPSKDGMYWKVGMATSLIDRLKSYSICFPKGFYIRMLATLPPLQPGTLWTTPNIDRAVRVIESKIHRALDHEEACHRKQNPRADEVLTDEEREDRRQLVCHDNALEVSRLTQVHAQSEWFRGKFADIKAIIARTLLRLGVGERVKIHLDLASSKYGPVVRGKESGEIPEGDTVEGVDTSPYLLEHAYEEKELIAANALVALDPAPLDPELRGLAIPEGPIEEREYEVRRIKGKRVFRGKLQYKVAWKGYKKENDSWEPVEHLPHAQEAIDDYEAREADKREKRELRRKKLLTRNATRVG